MFKKRFLKTITISVFTVGIGFSVGLTTEQTVNAEYNVSNKIENYDSLYENNHITLVEYDINHQNPANVSYWFEEPVVPSIGFNYRPTSMFISRYIPSLGQVSGTIYPVNPSAYNGETMWPYRGNLTRRDSNDPIPLREGFEVDYE